MPDDGDAPRLIARLVALDPTNVNGADVQAWIDEANGSVFPQAAQGSHSATATFGALAFGTPVENDTNHTILVSGTVLIASATAGVINLGVDQSGTPDVDPITPAITTAVPMLVAFSVLVAPAYTVSLTHTGTISVGTPVVIASTFNGGPAA